LRLAQALRALSSGASYGESQTSATSSLERHEGVTERGLNRRLPKLAEKMAPKMRTRSAHKLACFALPACCYHRHVVACLCTFRLCFLRRVDAAGLCELPENGLLLARVR
jgi:hypothetical protein